MGPAEYKMVQDQIVLLAQLVEPLDLREFIYAIDRAETIGPFLDPTLYRAALQTGRLDRLRTIAELFLPIQREIRAWKADEAERGAKGATG